MAKKSSTEHHASIYTKKGDKGETGLPGKRRLSKTDQLFEVLGNLDQTNAGIGVCLSLVGDKGIKDSLIETQRLLLEIGSCLASENPGQSYILEELPKNVTKQEEQMDAWDKKIPELKNFILPGGSSAGAQLHFTRTLVRQTERTYHRLPEENKLEPVSIYLNRLSDFFFEAARYANFLDKQKEEIWTQMK